MTTIAEQKKHTHDNVVLRNYKDQSQNMLIQEAKHCPDTKVWLLDGKEQWFILYKDGSGLYITEQWNGVTVAEMLLAL